MSLVEKVLLTLLGLVLVLGMVWVFQSWWQSSSLTSSVSQSFNNYDLAKQAEEPTDPCSPPAGYTEESWREHMSHHPDQYQQCLGK